MKQTDSKLKQQIKERKDYLSTIERDIELVTTAGNNQLLIIHGQIEVQETRKASLLKECYGLEQRIRELKILAER